MITKFKMFELYSDSNNISRANDMWFKYIVSVGFTGIVKTVASKLGYKVIGQEKSLHLGVGTCGLAFVVKHADDKNEKVLKITTDKSEALNAEFLSRKRATKSIVNYYNVFKIITEERQNYEELYGILMDKTEKLDATLKSVLSRYCSEFKRCNTLDEMINIVEDEDDLKYFSKNKWVMMSFLDGVKECKKWHIDIGDLFEGNMGILSVDGDKRLVFFDFGYSKEKKVKIKDTLYLKFDSDIKISNIRYKICSILTYFKRKKNEEEPCTYADVYDIVDKYIIKVDSPINLTEDEWEELKDELMEISTNVTITKSKIKIIIDKPKVTITNSTFEANTTSLAVNNNPVNNLDGYGDVITSTLPDKTTIKRYDTKLDLTREPRGPRKKKSNRSDRQSIKTKDDFGRFNFIREPDRSNTGTNNFS